MNKLLATRLAVLHALYEVSRRLRKVQNLSEVPVFGRPLAPSPDGPFPELIAWDESGYQDKMLEPFELPEEVFERIVRRAYAADPRLMYDWCEQQRRVMVTYEIEMGPDKLLDRFWEEEDVRSDSQNGSARRDFERGIRKP